MRQAIRKEAIRRQREWEEASRSARSDAMRRTKENQDTVEARVQTGIRRFLPNTNILREETRPSTPKATTPGP